MTVYDSNLEPDQYDAVYESLNKLLHVSNILSRVTPHRDVEIVKRFVDEAIGATNEILRGHSTKSPKEHRGRYKGKK